MQGPTIARVFPKEQNPNGLDWYAVTVVVESALLLRAVDHLRQSGACGRAQSLAAEGFTVIEHRPDGQVGDLLELLGPVGDAASGDEQTVPE